MKFDRIMQVSVVILALLGVGAVMLYLLSTWNKVAAGSWLLLLPLVLFGIGIWMVVGERKTRSNDWDAHLDDD